jgi:hypothetical protein
MCVWFVSPLGHSVCPGGATPWNPRCEGLRPPLPPRAGVGASIIVRRGSARCGQGTQPESATGWDKALRAKRMGHGHPLSVAILTDPGGPGLSADNVFRLTLNPRAQLCRKRSGPVRTAIRSAGCCRTRFR